MKKKTKAILWTVLIALVIIFICVWQSQKKKGVHTGDKEVTVEVTDDQGETRTYTAETDAEYLSELMDELAEDDDFTYTSSDSEYGMYIESINGVTADYDKDGAYWSILVNGEYGQYGADSQPVADGDTYSFVYEAS